MSSAVWAVELHVALRAVETAVDVSIQRTTCFPITPMFG